MDISPPPQSSTAWKCVKCGVVDAVSTICYLCSRSCSLAFHILADGDTHAVFKKGEGQGEEEEAGEKRCGLLGIVRGRSVEGEETGRGGIVGGQDPEKMV